MTKTNPTDWLFFADSDLALAHTAFEEKIFHLACFHAQQAVEKLLKALLIACGVSPPKIHALRELYPLIAKHEPSMEEHVSAINSLDRYYLPTRYPDALPGSLPEGLPTEEDARQAVADAEKLSDFIRPFIHQAPST